MVQCSILQVDVAFLTYNSNRNIANPSVKLDNSCVAGISELNKHRTQKRTQKHEMGRDAYQHYKWYNKMLMNELDASEDASNCKLKIVHWHIESGNAEAFKMNDVVYKAVSIIIGTDMEHWYCANTGRNASHSYGSRYRLTNPKDRLLEHTTSKLAQFTMATDELSRLRIHHNQNSKKCSRDFCANNCVECTRTRLPFGKAKTSRCVCYQEKEIGVILEESDEEDSYDHVSTDVSRKKVANRPKNNLRASSSSPASRKSALSSISEE